MIIPIWIPDNPSAKIWFTSDQHYSHQNIIKFCNRPYADTHTMNKALTEGYNSLVEDNDYVFHLGDLSFADKKSTRTIIAGLKGHKILIRGNHDREPDGFYLANGFKEIYSNCLLTLPTGGLALLNHKPEELPSLCDKLMAGGALIEGQICGHIHQRWKTDYESANTGEVFGITVNVGVDVQNFMPVSISDVLRQMGL